MQTLTPTRPTRPDQRIEQLLARLRRKQLDTAMAGNVSDSARYADRAWRVRLFCKNGRKAA